jgi:hypothetical protein
MFKHRPLFCPNVILLDSGKELLFPIEEAKRIVKKLVNKTKLVTVYIHHDLEDSEESQIIVRNTDYIIYRETENNKNRFTSQLFDLGGEYVYYIKTHINSYRRAFVHFYDLQSTDDTIVCISNFLANQLQASTVVVSDNLLEEEKNYFSDTLLQQVKLFSTTELLNFAIRQEN